MISYKGKVVRIMIACDKLGAQKQICGGGAYAGGIGFALGVDRMLTIESAANNVSI